MNALLSRNISPVCPDPISTISCFAMEQFFPASTIEYPNSLAEDIFTRSSSFFLTLSLKLLPFGSETLMQILVLEAWGTARMELALKLGTGGVENGPATNFFSTHEAIVSVTLWPCRRAMAEFFTVQPGKWADWKEGAPVERYSMHLFARPSSDFNSRCLLFSINSFSLTMEIFVSGWSGSGLKGKFVQNASGGLLL